MHWTVAYARRSCGHCGAAIAADVPFATFTVRRLVRCASCAGVPVDEAEVDLERFRLEREALTGQKTTTDATPKYAPRVTTPRPVQPADAVNQSLFDQGVHDGRLAQTGDPK